MTKLELLNTIVVLELEVEVLQSRLKPAGTGYLHTTIGTITDRIAELKLELQTLTATEIDMKMKYGRAVETMPYKLEGDHET